MNSKMISSLGVDLPEEAVEVSTVPIPEPIDPTSLVVINNPNLPPMEDIETNLVEGERQLESLIQTGLSMIKSMSEENGTLAPNLRNAHTERIVMVFQTTADVIKFKSELQLKKKKSRMDEAKFVGLSRSKDEKDGDPQVVNNNLFIQKDILHALVKARVEEAGDANFSDILTTPDPTK